jgi:hypothetical protein
MGNSATQFELAINANAITLGYLAECGDAILADKLLLTQPAWRARNPVGHGTVVLRAQG